MDIHERLEKARIKACKPKVDIFDLTELREALTEYEVWYDAQPKFYYNTLTQGLL